MKHTINMTDNTPDFKISLFGDTLSNQIEIELPAIGDFEFKSVDGTIIPSWRETQSLNTSIYWIKLPGKEIKEILVYKVKITDEIRTQKKES